MSDTNPDLEWEQGKAYQTEWTRRELKKLVVILRRANHNRLNDLRTKPSTSEKVEGTNLTDTNRGVSIIVDNSHAGDRTHPKGRKHTWTSKKTKVSIPMRMIGSLTIHIFVQKGMDFQIKIRAGKKRSTVKISVKIHQ
jgi:hypothetical protein